MDEGTTFIGLDVHKRSIAVAVRGPGKERPGEAAPASEPWRVPPRGWRW